MKKTEKTLKASMDRRLSFLDDLPSCRAAVQYRIAREEEPVMKKKISVGFVFAMVLVVLSAAALTYLASLLTALVLFLRFLIQVLTLFGRRDYRR